MSRTVALRRVLPDEVPMHARSEIDTKTLAEASRIVEDVEKRREEAVLEYASRFGDMDTGDRPLLIEGDELRAAPDKVSREVREVLERTAARIRRFAMAQRNSLRDVALNTEWGKMRQIAEPLQVAGCYAPGGRYPLPSSVLMTVIPAGVAGVGLIQVATPKVGDLMLAAAAIAGADRVLSVGGAQAIAALAFGVAGVDGCDVIVGPGNRWVTAAKQRVSHRVRIDMPAGPSEVLVFADRSASARLIAADMIAQAEHGSDSLAVLVTTEAELIEQVERALAEQVLDLPTADMVRRSLRRSFAVPVSSIEEGIEVCRRLAPEHLEIIMQEGDRVAAKVRASGAVFIGPHTPATLGDYGAGPNHVLPTAGSARSESGLSPLVFMRTFTTLEVRDTESARELLDDTILLARLEGLEAHARSAIHRLPEENDSNRKNLHSMRTAGIQND